MALNDRDLMDMRVEALYTHDAGGRMLRVNEHGGARAPRFFLGRTAQGSVWRFRGDVDDATARALDALCRAEPAGAEFLEPPYGAAPYLEMLAPVEQTESGPAYVCPPEVDAASGAVAVTAANAGLLPSHLREWAGDVPRCQPMLAVVVDGHAVSLCASVRITPRAHEAGVHTAPAFRGRGHAAAAVRAWAAAVRALGAVPLYSTSWENTASQALARSLGLRRFGADLNIA